MSQENVDFVKGLFAAGSAWTGRHRSRRCLSRSLKPAIPRSSGTKTRSGWMPMCTWSRRRACVLGAMARSVDEYGTEAERFVDCGDDVLVVAREHGRGAR